MLAIRVGFLTRRQLKPDVEEGLLAQVQGLRRRRRYRTKPSGVRTSFVTLNERLRREGEPVVITPQVVAEFWNVAARLLHRN
jgi:hypothetical protein